MKIWKEVGSLNDCLFCKIVQGESPCHKIWEDNKHLAFLSIFPNTEGFSVLVTKIHYESYFAVLPRRVVNGIVLAAQKVCRLLDDSFEDVARTGFVFEGYGINHLHAKLIPLHGTKTEDIGGGWKQIISMNKQIFSKYEGYICSNGGPRANNEYLEKLAKKIRKD